jgi:hypothetical protein
MDILVKDKKLSSTHTKLGKNLIQSGNQESTPLSAAGIGEGRN